jgi:hypothetical protein
MYPEFDSRRTFIKKACLAVLGSAVPVTTACAKEKNGTHIVSLSFDDGFRRSFVRTAEIYETFGLSACFNVIAGAHQADFEPVGEYISTSVVGDFKLWNGLQERGHELMPHGYSHAHLPDLPLPVAEEMMEQSLQVFEANLTAFKREEAIFNFPFNHSSPPLESWLESQVRAFRTGGSIVNPLPTRETQKLTCNSFGPGNIDEHLDRVIQDFLSGPGGWVIYNTHGLDGEGWGPLSSSYLKALLARLVKLENVRVLPVGQALKEFS